MKPKDYIDENYVPTDEDFEPEKIDVKEQLRKDIKKQCRFNAVGQLCFIFMTVALINTCWHDSIYTVIFLIICALWAMFLVFANYRISRAHTVQEMQRWHNRMNKDSLFFKVQFVVLGLSAVIITVLSMKDEYPWYLIAFVVIIIVAIVVGILWLNLNHDKDSVGEDIQRLKELEDEEMLKVKVKE